jgi:hypothetical protein
MQSIGERLEEARKRRGISVREASEASKIRGDFLLSFENNQFDIGLPEIYVRGFLRNYSTFLKVEGEKIVTDYNALLIGDAKPARKETRELFGRMELPDRTRPASDGANGNAAGARRRPAGEEPIEQPREREAISPEMANVLKIGAIAAIGIILILAIVWLIKGIISGPSAARTGTPASQTVAPAQLDTIRLIALDGVHVTVRQLSDGAVVFDGPLAKGEERTVSFTGKVRMNYDDGRNIQVRYNGTLYRMTVNGPSTSVFPP